MVHIHRNIRSYRLTTCYGPHQKTSLVSIQLHSPLTQGTPAHNALHCQVVLASGRSLGRDWRRRPGRPRARWTDQLPNDTGCVPANLWRQTGHPTGPWWSYAMTTHRKAFSISSPQSRTHSHKRVEVVHGPLVWHWSPLQGLQPDTSRSCCKTTDTGPVCHVVACLLPSFQWYQFILLGDRSTWVWTTCPELLLDSDPAGNRTHDHLI